MVSGLILVISVPSSIFFFRFLNFRRDAFRFLILHTIRSLINDEDEYVESIDVQHKAPTYIIRISKIVCISHELLNTIF